jgi:MATE family multidrug resistance protein
VTALVTGAGFMTGTALLFLAVPGALARLYSPDPGVVALASALIPLAGIFQVFDGTQVTAIGVLRGVGDTRTPFLVTLMGYWAVGMPFGILLGLRLGLGAVGLWGGGGGGAGGGGGGFWSSGSGGSSVGRWPGPSSTRRRPKPRRECTVFRWGRGSSFRPSVLPS